MNQTIAEQIGSIVRKLRTEQGLTQQAIADEIGTSFSFVGRVERGESNITIETILKISNALNIDFFEFMSLGRRQESEEILAINALLLKRSEEEQRKALIILKQVFDEV